MKVLVIGSGGREHALAWKLAQSPKVQMVWVAPGNGGTASTPGVRNIPITDFATLAAFVEREEIALTVVGPDNALADGVVDFFQARGLKIFGPTQAAAQLESSKEFAKDFMARHKIPTAAYRSFTEAAPAHAYLDGRQAPIVIKADGLALGKGVVVAATLEDAHAAVDSMLGERKFGEAGAKIVIEDFLEGEEASFFVLSDGRHVLPLATAQDHKRLLDGDHGPNTGGMGAYSPAPVVTPAVHARVMREIVQPAIAGMAAEGRPFVGFLYCGLMIDKAGRPSVVEFNARMGDPETQPIMMRLKSDLAAVIEQALDGTLDRVEIEWDRRTALCVVLAARGYPESPRKGDPITGIPAPAEDCMVFHAGTTLDGTTLKTAGGRVLGVTALGDSPRIAQKRAYDAVTPIRFDGMQYRSDIGWRAISRRT